MEINENELHAIAKLKAVMEDQQIKCIHAVGATVALAVLHQFACWYENAPPWLIESPLYLYFFVSNSTQQQLSSIPAYLWPHLGIAQSILTMRSNFPHSMKPIENHGIAVAFMKTDQGSSSSSIVDLHVIIHCKRIL